MRILIAGASGLIGLRLIPLLTADGHVVAGMTRSPEKAALLREHGALPVLCDVFDASALTEALAAFGPEVVFHQLTDLPDDAADRAGYSDLNDRMRSEGTRNASLGPRLLRNFANYQQQSSRSATRRNDQGQIVAEVRSDLRGCLRETGFAQPS